MLKYLKKNKPLTKMAKCVENIFFFDNISPSKHRTYWALRLTFDVCVIIELSSLNPCLPAKTLVQIVQQNFKSCLIAIFKYLCDTFYV